MAINRKVSDHIIDSIDAFIAEVISELDHDAKIYVLKGLDDVVSNQLYDLEEVTA